MFSARTASLLLAALLTISGVSRAQQNVPTTNPPRGRSADEILREATAALAASSTQRSDSAKLGALPIPSVGIPRDDSLARDAYRESVRAYYHKLTADYSYTTAAFRWQMFSSQIIFYVVMLLVLAGLWFSWMQFQRDHPSRAAKPAANAGVAVTPPEASQLKLGTQGLEVTSSVLGVIILVISLAFLYLYLVYVYPISVVK